ncbi:MAG: quinone oxidoreductase [Alphaproteobacteria bacterium]|nr:quinone oxidoreductase [Alphaproteobacteria bacterium]
MAKTVRIHEFGGLDKLKIEDVDPGQPGPGEVLLRQEAAGVHFADTLVREGKYFLKPDLPSGLGLEAAGIVEAVGPDVGDFSPGDRAAYRFNLGAYTEARLIPAAQLHRLPDNVDAKTAVAATVRGMTAQYLVRQIYKVGPEDTVLVHAAAGGMGTLLTQWCKHLGATVIGTVGSPAKAEIAAANGCDHVIDYLAEDFAVRVEDISGGAGIPVAYDGVGAAVYEGTVACLEPCGWYVNYGHSSGFLPPIDAMELNKKSLIFTKASLKDYMRTPDRAKSMLDEVFDLLGSGVLDPGISREYSLDEVAEAQRAIASRDTTGAIVLVP